MLTINSLEEMKPYYNENTNTYEFIENSIPIDVHFTFSIDIKSNIKAGDINARDINAWDINARNIDAWDISFYAICGAYQTLKCKSIEGRRKNAKYFCLDNEVEFIKQDTKIGEKR